jgi:hypothetical protein
MDVRRSYIAEFFTVNTMTSSILNIYQPSK